MREYKAHENHPLNDKYEYQRRQIKDTIDGPTSIKNGGTLYLPMPASFAEVEKENVASITANQTNKFEQNNISQSNLPFYSNNPAYMAYLQRARFPGFTANILRGLLGMVEKYPPEIVLPPELEYIEETCTLDGKSLEELFYICLNGIFSDGKFAIVVDFNEDNEFYFSPYCADANKNWKYGTHNKKKTLIHASFQDDDETIKDFELNLIEDCYYVNNYNEKGELIDTDKLKYMGKPIQDCPIFFMGSIENSADSFISPLIGISDCALEIYQIHADLRQAEYLTCNPTLFIFGMADGEKPSTIGSQVLITVRNPQGRAEYPSTDTSALNHLRERIKDISKEAAEMGVSFIVGGGGVESAEALSLRQSNKGTNLIHCVNMISKGINDALKFICKLKNISTDLVSFEPNIEFIELVLGAQDIQALVSAWMQGGIPQDILWDNMREARYIKPDDTNEKIKQRIMIEPPSVGREENTFGGKDGEK